MIKDLLREFMRLIENGKVDVYNESSFQHELGIFFRNRLVGYKVQFERILWEKAEEYEEED